MSRPTSKECDADEGALLISALAKEDTALLASRQQLDEAEREVDRLQRRLHALIEAHALLATEL